MTTVNRSALVHYTPKQMYDLVNDIDAYPKFLPWCSASTSTQLSDRELQGQLVINKAGIVKSFTTLNTLFPYEKIDIQLVDGPFKQLSGVWQFIAIEQQGTKVTLDLQFELEHSWMGRVLSKIFSGIAGSLVKAFCEEAKRRYD